MYGRNYIVRLLVFTTSCLFTFSLPAHGDIAVLTDGGEASYEVRSRASYSENTRLGDAEVAALLAFLNRAPEKDVATEDELASLKNNVADLLLRQERVPSALRRTFTAGFNDAGQGEIWREYIVQKFPELALRLAGKERAEALAFLRARIDDTDYIYAGTALLGLQRVHVASPNLVSGAEVAKAADKVLHGEAYAEASRLTALQVLAAHEPGAARAKARSLLTGEASVMFKASALATLGLVGEGGDIALLERYARSPELRLRTAARASLKKLMD